MGRCAFTLLLFATSAVLRVTLPFLVIDYKNAYKQWTSGAGAGKMTKSQKTNSRKYIRYQRLATTNITRKNLAKSPLRVYRGTSVDSRHYPYVVALTTVEHQVHRYCSGSLITPEWVLSAAHCIEDPKLVKNTWIFYGVLENINSNPSTKSKVIKAISHHRYHLKSVVVGLHEGFQWALANDIGLLLVDKVEMNQWGKLSAADYMSLVGCPVTYIGAGTTNSEFENETEKEVNQINSNDMQRPLQVGEAVVIRCDDDDKELGVASYICLRPKCSNRLQQVRAGDSGGPLLSRGKIVGVCSSGVSNEYVTFYTAVSPYFDWLHKTMIAHKYL